MKHLPQILTCLFLLTLPHNAAAQKTDPLMLTDGDKDGIPDKVDNCLQIANPTQQDNDADGFGNFCDPDLNNDLIVNATDIELFEKLPQTADITPHLDFNGDRKRDQADAEIVKAWQGKTPGPAAKYTSSGLIPEQIALIINENDPFSVQVGEYYRVKRNIPDANIIRVKLPLVVRMKREEFAPIKAEIDKKLPPYVQVLALAWTLPYKVECNSITSALSRGFMAYPCDNKDPHTTTAWTCAHATPNPYYNSISRLPYSQYGFRPSMLVTGKTLEDAKTLIDRGVASDNTHPFGHALVMHTSDEIRNRRAVLLDPAIQGYTISPKINIEIVKANNIKDQTPVMFLFQGQMKIPEPPAATVFPPGAIIDNLTSLGGIITDIKGKLGLSTTSTGHTNALDMIGYGATGSFGNVSEPCNGREKYSAPDVLIAHYTSGQTLIEAYWKSFQQTFQALWVGDPLANPWAKERPAGYSGGP